MRYTIRKSVVQVLGEIWQPGFTCAMDFNLSNSDVENIIAGMGWTDGDYRGAVLNWLDAHAGDFSHIIDFSASLEMPMDRTVEIAWQDEENEFAYLDAMYGDEIEADSDVS